MDPRKVNEIRYVFSEHHNKWVKFQHAEIPVLMFYAANYIVSLNTDTQEAVFIKGRDATKGVDSSVMFTIDFYSVTPDYWSKNKTVNVLLGDV